MSKQRTFYAGNVINTSLVNGIFLIFQRGGDVEHYHKQKYIVNTFLMDYETAQKQVDGMQLFNIAQCGDVKKYIKKHTYISLEKRGEHIQVTTVEIIDKNPF